MPDSQTSSNLPELTVTQLSDALKRTIETTFDRVRVRGELGRVTIARSGHLYADIKDDRSVLNTIMWKGQVDRLGFRPEEGLEIVATGRLSTYAGRSNYQLIADTMSPAGAGALMALLEARKQKLAAEGLFDAAHRKPLPFLPRVIGVVTSPTGAVIRDILHRIADRFPTTVILWPALVQGEAAAGQIARAIAGFNAMTGPDRPDVLIVGRGGGSIEDLWPFNEEIVVRAAFDSVIPLISAVGHETDTTLIDFVSDARAPTPTGAAEIAVPVRADLLLSLGELAQRQKRALAVQARRSAERLSAARLPAPDRLFSSRRQAFDFAATRLPRAALQRQERASARLAAAAARLRSPQQVVDQKRQVLANAAGRLVGGFSQVLSRRRLHFTRTGTRLRVEPLMLESRRARQTLLKTSARTAPALRRIIDVRRQALGSEAKFLETLSYQSTLARGYALVRTQAGRLIRSSAEAGREANVRISFADGEVMAVPSGDSFTPAPQKPKPKTRTPKPRAPKSQAAGAVPATKPGQGDLF